MDNKKKKKLDGKRIDLNQKHERDYLKKSCSELVRLIKIDKKICEQEHMGQDEVVLFTGVTDKEEGFKVKTVKLERIERIAKALLKCLENRK